MQTQNLIKELTEGMQHLCAVANRIVARNGDADPIEVDLLMDDLRRLYGVALMLGGSNLPIPQSSTEPPLPDQEMLSSTVMATMAAMSVEAPIMAEPKPTPIQKPEAEPMAEIESEQQSEPEPMAEPVTMHSFETENGLLFDEVVIKQSPEPEPISEPEPEPIPEPEPVPIIEPEPIHEPEPTKAPQSSLLDYLKHPIEDRPSMRTLGESLLSPKSDTPLEKKVDDLRTVININDKFSFMSELFTSCFVSEAMIIFAMSAERAVSWVRLMTSF